MKKRILQFIGSFHQGGSERQALALMKNLHNEGPYEVFAATLNDDGILKPEAERIGLAEIAEFPLTSFYNANFVRQVRICASYLREKKIDLIQTHDFYTNVFGMAAATLAGVPVRIASKRETGGMRSAGQEFVEKASFGRANAIVVNSEAVRDHLVDRGFSPSETCLIYNGIDMEPFVRPEQGRAALLARIGLPNDENIHLITLVANLRHAVKNVPMLLRVAKRVAADRPDAHFVIAGEGELESELEDMAKDLGVADNVNFIGRCTDVPSLAAASYACVLTSTAEGFSNSILEYMAAAKPVVATDVGGAAEAITEGVTGYLVASGDDAAMAARLIELLDNEPKAGEMGITGKNVVEQKFSSASQLAKTIELYESFPK